MTATTANGRQAGLNGSAPVVGSQKAPAALRVQTARPRPPAAAVALCLLLMLGSGAAAGAAVVGSDKTTTVIVAARPLPAGTVIGREDLKPAELAGSGLAAIRATEGGLLLGRTTVGPIPAGTLLVPAMVADDPPPARGEVAVGLALTPGQLPAAELRPGRFVTLYQLAGGNGGTAAPAGGAGAPIAGGASAGAGGAPADVLIEKARVLSVSPTGSGGTLVTVVVTQALGPAVSAASFAGLVGVGLLPVGTS